MVVGASRTSFVRLHVIRFALLALGALLLGHQAVYAAQYGDGAAFSQAMTAGGHDAYWGVFTTVALSGLLLLLARSAWRVLEARRTISAGAAGPPSVVHVRSYPRELALLWPPLFGTVAVAYGIQENIEHLIAQGHLPGFAPLVGAEAPLALPILGLVTLAFALVGALVRWRLAVLEAEAARISTAQRRWRIHGSQPVLRWSLVSAIRATFWSRARQGPVRAPPAVA
ncbi:MAG TPA: hypothetical protein VMH24_03750 [Candidatus Sulfotelmatobacter sp.]|nr:hypothetical protein [Candidatus Sulfotelmatobacter sp.]